MNTSPIPHTAPVKFKRVAKNEDAYFRKVGSQKVIAWIIFGVFVIYVFTLVYPFLWLVTNSFRTVTSYAGNPNKLPTLESFTMQNFSDALTLRTAANNTNMLGLFLNSLIISGVGTALTVITSSCTAYIMAKFQFRGKAAMYSIIIFSMILPVVGTLPALLRTFKSIGLYDNYLGLFFLYSGGMGNNFILLYSFFKNISWQYAEAGYIDGASEFRVFLQIMIPLALPSIVSVAILTFIGLWNEYTMPSVLLPSRPTIAVGLYQISVKLSDKNRPQMYAAVVLAIIPVIVIFSIFQKTIMTNTVAGGLKG